MFDVLILSEIYFFLFLIFFFFSILGWLTLVLLQCLVPSVFPFSFVLSRFLCLCICPSVFPSSCFRVLSPCLGTGVLGCDLFYFSRLVDRLLS